MSTKSTIWYCADRGRELHVYWELGERVPGKSAPIYLEIEVEGKEASLRLPKEFAQKIRELLDPENSFGLEVM